MLNRRSATSPLPYIDIVRPVLGLIYESLRVIYEGRFEDLPEELVVSKLKELGKALMQEKWAKPPQKKNPHLTGSSPFGRLDEVDLKLPRICRLCLEAAHFVREHESESGDDVSKGIFVPSPLSILVDSLAIPARPESYGYGFALGRALLFSYFKVHPNSQRIPEGWDQITIPDLQEALETFRIYSAHRDNIHYHKTNRTKAFLAHFLGMCGALTLRFGTSGKRSVDLQQAQEDCISFLQRKPFLQHDDINWQSYEFRLSSKLLDLPDSQEVLNGVMGLPLPIAGASTVFFGGLQRSHRDSLVVSISGSPGTGKTSLALSLAAVLAPFGTKCLYCTFEEDAQTLTRRAASLIPQYFRRTTLPNVEEADWLFPVELDPSVVSSIANFSAEYVPILKEYLADSSGGTEERVDEFPAIAPLLVIVDSLTTLLGSSDGSQLGSMCDFIRRVRELGCIVVLLSADEIPKDSRLEYLVDTVIKLRHEDTDTAVRKPFRLLQLVKTRLQMSRPGAHILHLSGERGVRISPQLPSQLDSHEIHRTPLPNVDYIIDTLRPNIGFQVPSRSLALRRLVNIFPGSRVLIHGHGSSGKAILATKVLMAHVISAVSGETVSFSSYKRPRILVVSFLYPADYYLKNFSKLWRAFGRAAPADSKPKMKVLALRPGFQGPEDFIGQVISEMERGLLEGWPYTGLLLDGLHNIFLQFPMLQGSHLVWPGLYSILSRYGITIVTTFTTFSKSHPSAVGQNKDDEELILKGQLPFLHVLVQGTDFYLQVESTKDRVNNRLFHISVKGAINQKIPSWSLTWDAEDYSFSIDSEELMLL